MSDFLYNVPRSFLIHIVRKADAGRGYDDTEVRASVLLDVDRGSVKSQRDYARIWGRSRGWIRNRWEEIQRDVTDLCTSQGRQLNGPLAEKLPEGWIEEAGYGPSPLQAQKKPKPSPEKGPSEPERAKPSPNQAQKKPTSSPHTIHPTSLHPHPSLPETRANGKKQGSGHPAVVAYRDATGHGIAADQWAAKIIRAVGEDPADVEAWSEQCLVWANTGRWNEQNVPKMLRAFEEERNEHKQANDEQSNPQRQTASSQRARRRAAEQDPSGSFQRISKAVDDALGL